MKRSYRVLTILVISFFTVFGAIYIGSSQDSKDSKDDASKLGAGQSINDSEVTPEVVNNISEEESLKYYIEEEKLAYDVYLAMYEKYGTRIFSNIMKSEMNHQEKVLTLLKSRNIQDPRSGSPGIFINQELQELYNELISLGNKSQEDAIKVGIIIEERDIADLTKEISRTKDNEVKSVLEELKKASENHLQTFKRQSKANLSFR
jgi:hypothetical protein